MLAAATPDPALTTAEQNCHAEVAGSSLVAPVPDPHGLASRPGALSAAAAVAGPVPNAQSGQQKGGRVWSGGVRRARLGVLASEERLRVDKADRVLKQVAHR